MSIKFKNYILTFGLILFLSFSGNVFASPQGQGIEFTPYLHQNGNYYLMDESIPISLYSTGDCSYASGNDTIWQYSEIRNFDNTWQGGQAGSNFDYSDALSLGYTTGWAKLSCGDPNMQCYPETGDYIVQFMGTTPQTSTICKYYAYFAFHVDKSNNTASGISLSTNGVCGLDNGEDLGHAPPTIPYTLCLEGTETSVYYNTGLGQWEWSCLGENGGSDDNCISYLTTDPIDATCGADNGQTLNDPPINFCGDGLLMYPTYVENITNYAWTCGGLNGGDDIFCSAIKGNVNPPEEPEEEDCSQLSVPNIWFCQIRNILNSAFFPTQAKFTELSETINEVQNRAPFNYIRLAGDTLSDISNNIQTEDLSMSFFGMTGTITGISALTDPIRMSVSWLLLFGFLVWTISYIKHFFK
jgi:hypothetical protein